MKKLNVKSKIYCLICARGGSKGIKNKNIKRFQNKPLIFWTINIAKKTNFFDKIILSTDSKKIQKIGIKNKITVPFLRPKKLSTNKAKEIDVWRHCLNFYKNKDELPDYLVVLPPTAPLRKISDISLSIKKIKKNKKADVLISITEANRNPYFNIIEKKKNGFAKIVINKKQYFRRQDAPKVYDMTTVIFIVKTKFILRKKNIFEGNVITHYVPKSRSIDIDNLFDWKLASYLFTKINKK